MTAYALIKSYYLFVLTPCLALRSAPAAAVLFAAICAGRATTHFGTSQGLLIFAYILLAVVAIFFVDWASGAILLLVTIAIACGMMEILDHTAKVRWGEALIVLGIVICGISGPTGGLFDFSHRYGDRSDHVASLVPSNTQSVSMPPEAHKP